jgi:hypothetical protein
MRFEVTHPIWLEGRVVPVGEVVEQAPKRMQAWLRTGSVREAAPASAIYRRSEGAPIPLNEEGLGDGVRNRRGPREALR